jgi:hypothetical protein
MKTSIPIELINERRWALCVRALLYIQINCKKLLDMKKLTIIEDEKNLNFIYDQDNEEEA